MVFQGHVENGAVVLDRPLPLADGTLVRVEPISGAPADFWQSFSLNELAARQGVSVPGGIDDIVGGWPADEVDDDFAAVSTRWRQCEPSR
jgi:hypothetical protein